MTQEEYLRLADALDRAIGGISVEQRKESRFKSQGAEATQSSDYRGLVELFRGLTFTESDVLADVGCGEGRVLTWLVQQGFPGRLVGVELDPDVAGTCSQRLNGCPNTEVLCGSILDQHKLMEEVTACYLFNPFNGKIFSKFTAMAERECTHPLTLIYLFDYYAGYLQDRPGWTLVREAEIPRDGMDPAHGSIWTFTPHTVDK